MNIYKIQVEDLTFDKTPNPNKTSKLRELLHSNNPFIWTTKIQDKICNSDIMDKLIDSTNTDHLINLIQNGYTPLFYIGKKVANKTNMKKYFFGF